MSPQALGPGAFENKNAYNQVELQTSLDCVIQYSVSQRVIIGEQRGYECHLGVIIGIASNLYNLILI